jgi:hypothetical protein
MRARLALGTTDGPRSGHGIDHHYGECRSWHHAGSTRRHGRRSGCAAVLGQNRSCAAYRRSRRFSGQPLADRPGLGACISTPAPCPTLIERGDGNGLEVPAEWRLRVRSRRRGRTSGRQDGASSGHSGRVFWKARNWPRSVNCALPNIWPSEGQLSGLCCLRSQACRNFRTSSRLSASSFASRSMRWRAALNASTSMISSAPSIRARVV